MMIRIHAYQIAENINLKSFRAAYAGVLISSTTSDLFYRLDGGHIFILNYGVVVFANVDDVQRSAFIELLRGHCMNVMKERLQEDFMILQKDTPSPEFAYNNISVSLIHDGVIRITMLQVAQSLALDFYQEAAQQLFDNSVLLTHQLEKKGRLSVSKKNLLKFIGKALNTKNRIIDNLYIFDAPAVVWEDEYLGKINTGLTQTFDIGIRFKELEYMLRQVESNLSVFVELVNAEESSRLEWIIIVLIFIEILHLFLNQFFH